MRTVLSFIAAAAMSVASGARAQTGSIGGKVTDKATRLPIEGVTVSVQGTSYGISSKSDGSYSILGVPPGTYIVNAKRSGYRPLTLSDVVVSVGVKRSLDIPMASSGTRGDGLGSLPPVIEQGTVSPASLLVDTKFFPLLYLSNADAAKLVAPFVQGVFPSWGVFDAGPGVRGVTAKASKNVLSEIDSTLRVADRPPVSVVLRFQLIAAVDAPGHDPGIPADVDATLHDLFKYGSYKLISQGTATSAQARFSLTMSDGDHYYMLQGGMAGSGGRGQAVMQGDGRVGARILDASGVQLEVTLQGQMDQQPPGNRMLQWTTLLSTGLTVPIGQTVVLGSGAAVGERRAVILTVRPELLKP